LNRYLGHRRAFHGFPLWGAVTLGGLLAKPLLWIGLGALSHVMLDALNTSGVTAIMPFSERVCVLFSRKWRFPTGSRQELFLLVALGSLAWAGGYQGAFGSLRGALAYVVASPRLALQQWEEKGTKICRLEGRFRFQNGEIKEGSFLLIGKEGQKGFACLYEGRLLHVPKDGEFLRAKLKCEEKSWYPLLVRGFAETKTPGFFFDGRAWRKLEPGKPFFGYALFLERPSIKSGLREKL